jgi:WD40 repeat protein
MKNVPIFLITLLLSHIMTANEYAHSAKKRKASTVLTGQRQIKKQKTGDSQGVQSSGPLQQSFDPEQLLPAVIWQSAIKQYTDFKKLTVLRDHDKFIHDVQFSSRGNSMASAGVSGTIILRDTISNAIISSMSNHKMNAIYTLSYNPTDLLLASAGLEKTISLWNTDTGKLAQSLVADKPTFTTKFNSSGTQLASAGSSGRILLYDIEKAILTTALHGHLGAVQDILWFNDDSTLASFGDDSVVRLWDSRSGEVIRTFPGCRRWEQHLLACTRDDKKLMWVANNGITIADLTKSDAFLYALPCPQKELFTSVTLSHENQPRIAATTNGKGSVYFYDLKTGNHIDTLTHDHGALQAVSFSPDDNCIAATDRSHNVLLWRQMDLISQFKDSSESVIHY